MTGSVKPQSSPADAAQRERAIRETARNVVVVAGAGSGKTSLLVERCLHLLLTEAVGTRELLAITFTDLAASEMRRRVRLALEHLTLDVDGIPDAEGNTDAARVARRWIDDGRERGRLRSRAADILEDLDRAEITTIHGYCAGLLRRQALAAGVPPDLRLDEGLELERFGDEAWRRFLSTLPPEDSEAVQIFGRFHADELRTWFLAMLESAFDGVNRDRIGPEGGDAWVRARAAVLLGELTQIPESANSKVLTAFTAMAQEELGILTRDGVAELASSRREPLRDPPAKLKSLTSEHVQQLKRIQRFLNVLRQVDDASVRGALAFLTRGAAAARADFLGRGWITFDGLLVHARNVLRDRLDVRASEGRRYRAILVDEFQDTDPLQYEIVFFLGELDTRPRAQGAWAVKLAPGKLFLVGDPKQSIYRFRGADIRAYAAAEEKILTGGGVRLSLHANFRTTAAILTPLDRLFLGWISAQDDAERDARAAPEYETMSPFRAEPLTRFGAGPRVEVIAPQAEGAAPAGRVPMDEQRRQEAEALAADLEAVLAAGGRTAADHAILLRSFTDVGVYTSALDKRGIPYVLEGGKSFYLRAEVLELLAWMRTVSEPNDAISLVAALRSATGAVPDAELDRFAQAHPWNVRQELDVSAFPGVARVFGWIREFRDASMQLTATELLHRIVERTRLLEVHAAAHDGAQRVVNLQKCQEIAEALVQEKSLPFARVVAELERRVRGGAEEQERAVADAHAVSILTIHKAKGLEFNSVYLPDLNRREQDRREPARLRLRSASGSEGGGVDALAPRSAIRSLGNAIDVLREDAHVAAEGRRLLYVAATRARERLVFVMPPGPSSTTNAWGERLRSMFPAPEVSAGAAVPSSAPMESRVNLDVAARWIALTPSPKPDRARAAPDVVKGAQRCRELGALSRARTHPPIVAPTALVAEALTSAPSAPRREVAPRTVPPRVVGLAIHALLERADFASRGPLAGDDAVAAAVRDACLDTGFDPKDLTPDVKRLWRSFEGGRIRERLRTVRILARELPILGPAPTQAAGTPDRKSEPRQGQTPLCAGVADLVFEENGRWIVADWKTDDVKSDADLTLAAERHRPQVGFYARALTAASRRAVYAEIFFVRLDRAVGL